jgi:hypothetical protein
MIVFFKPLVSVPMCAMLLAGCAAPPPPPEPVLPDGRIAVVPARYTPEANFNVYARGKSEASSELAKEGAAAGAAAGAVAPLQGPGVGVLLYPFIAPFTILGGTIAGGISGQASGAVRGLPDEEAAKVSAVIDQAIHQLGVHVQISRRVVERARHFGWQVELVQVAGPGSPKENLEYGDLRTQYDAVLEVVVDKVGMAARKGDPPRLALEFQMHARVVDWSGKGVAGVKALEWAARPRPYDKWASASAELLAADFDEGYETLAQYVWEMLFPQTGTK